MKTTKFQKFLKYAFFASVIVALAYLAFIVYFYYNTPDSQLYRYHRGEVYNPGFPPPVTTHPLYPADVSSGQIPR